MIDFNEMKAEKEGRTTPKSLLTNALNRDRSCSKRIAF